jgi:hypothetical protein
MTRQLTLAVAVAVALALILVAYGTQQGYSQRQSNSTTAEPSQRALAISFFQRHEADDDIDTSKALTYGFSFVGVMQNRLAPTMTYLHKEGFSDIILLRVQNDKGLFDIVYSENRVHTAESYGDRVQQLATYAQQQGFRFIEDWTIGYETMKVRVPNAQWGLYQLPPVEEIASVTAEMYQYTFIQTQPAVPEFTVPRTHYGSVLEFFANPVVDMEPRLESPEIGSLKITDKSGRVLRLTYYWYMSKKSLHYSIRGVRCFDGGKGRQGFDAALTLDTRLRAAHKESLREEQPGQVPRVTNDQ